SRNLRRVRVTAASRRVSLRDALLSHLAGRGERVRTRRAGARAGDDGRTLAPTADPVMCARGTARDRARADRAHAEWRARALAPTAGPSGCALGWPGARARPAIRRSA